MTCPPLYVTLPSGEKAIVTDGVQQALDAARDAYRRTYTRGYSLSERGEVEKAQSILDRANDDLNAAEQRYLKARGL